MNTQIVHSQEAKKAISIGYQKHWGFRVAGQDGMPDPPIYRDGWWFEILKSQSTIPPEGLKRLAELEKAGIKYQGLVIGHEAPKLFAAPPEEPKTKKIPKIRVHTDFEVLPVLETITRALGEVLMGVLAVFGLFLIAAIRLDPALIVVLEDGTWLEVMTWYE